MLVQQGFQCDGIIAADVSGQLIICSMAAYGFSRLKFVGRDTIFILYLATMIAEAHGGKLQLLNPGEPGARFECRIPI